MLEVLFKKNCLKITEKKYSYISSWLQLINLQEKHSCSFFNQRDFTKLPNALIYNFIVKLNEKQMFKNIILKNIRKFHFCVCVFFFTIFLQSKSMKQEIKVKSSFYI